MTTTYPISDNEFTLFQGLMHDLAGVHLPPTKKDLVCGRLLRRLHHLGVGSFGAYFRRITAGGDTSELQCALDLLTTHETYFFREGQHFEFLARQMLPSVRMGQHFRVWSAACSSGEEAYSIAMVLMQHLGDGHPWEVFASDIGAEVLKRAREGVYATERIQQLPESYLRRYCLRGVGRREGTLRIAESVRNRVRFERINLNEALPAVGQFDVIFLRNVLIYFNQETKQQVVERLAHQLVPGGRLFIGHSESLNGITNQLHQEQPAIYRKG
jgi:chemotaxis protein methyltransferase CheR